MKLNEIINESRGKNEKFDNVQLSDFSDKQFFGALNLKASKEGTGVAGSCANWIFEMARTCGLDLIQARRLGNILQQEALDSKHDGEGSMLDTVWYKIAKLKSFRGTEFELRNQINFILSNINAENTIENEMLF